MGSLLPQLPLPLSLPPHPPTGPSCPQTLTPRYRNPRPRPCHAPARSPCHFRREGAVAAAPSLRLRAARRNRGWPCEAGRLAAGPGGQNDMDGRRPMGRRGHVWNRHAPGVQVCCAYCQRQSCLLARRQQRVPGCGVHAGRQHARA